MTGNNLHIKTFYLPGFSRIFAGKDMLRCPPLPHISGFFIYPGMNKNSVSFCIISRKILHPVSVSFFVSIIRDTISRFIHRIHRGKTRQNKLFMISHQSHYFFRAVSVLQFHDTVEHTTAVIPAMNIISE